MDQNKRLTDVVAPSHPADPYTSQDYELSPEEFAEAEVAIRESEEDIRMGRTRAAEEVFAELREKLRIAS